MDSLQRQGNPQNNVHQQRRQLTVALVHYLRFHFQLIRDILISDRQLVGLAICRQKQKNFCRQKFLSTMLLSTIVDKNSIFLKHRFLSF